MLSELKLGIVFRYCSIWKREWDWHKLFFENCETFKSWFWLSWIILGLLQTDQMPNPLEVYLNEDMLIIEVKDIRICHCIAKVQLNLLSCQQLFAIRQMHQLEKQYKEREKERRKQRYEKGLALTPSLLPSAFNLCPSYYAQSIIKHLFCIFM